MGFRYSSKRKKHQRQLNTALRECNKYIEDDTVWRGRFAVRCVESYLVKYEDESGYYLKVRLRFIDKKTSKYHDVCGVSYNFTFFNGSKLFWLMNNVITKIFEPDGFGDGVDYRQHPMPKLLLN